jgi:hypothetical protein
MAKPRTTKTKTSTPKKNKTRKPKEIKLSPEAAARWEKIAKAWKRREILTKTTSDSPIRP